MEVKDIISSGLLELYITGLTSPEETLQVEQWAQQYPEVKTEIDELQDAIERYAMAQAIQPDAELKDKILAKIKPADTVKDNEFSQIRSTTQVQDTVEKDQPIEAGKLYSIPVYYKWAIAASVILLIGSLILNYTFYNKYQNSSRELQVAKNELEKQQQMAEAMSGDIKVVSDRNAMPVVLNGTDKAPDAVAKIFWMKNTGDVYIDPTNLPKAPAGMQYQLWAIVDGKPVDAGMIPLTVETKKGTYHIQKMKSFGKAQAFAITLEKAGGSATPTLNQMIVQAKI